MSGSARFLRPKEPGVYRVTGFNLPDHDGEAVVEVIEHEGELRTNIHIENSNRDIEDWSYVDDMSDRFKWERIDVCRCGGAA